MVCRYPHILGFHRIARLIGFCCLGLLAIAASAPPPSEEAPAPEKQHTLSSVLDDHLEISPDLRVGEQELIFTIRRDHNVSTLDNPIYVLKIERLYDDLAIDRLIEVSVWWPTGQDQTDRIQLQPVDDGFWANRVSPGVSDGTFRLILVAVFSEDGQTVSRILEQEYELELSELVLTRAGKRELAEARHSQNQEKSIETHVVEQKAEISLGLILLDLFLLNLGLLLVGGTSLMLFVRLPAPIRSTLLDGVRFGVTRHRRQLQKTFNEVGVQSHATEEQEDQGEESKPTENASPAGEEVVGLDDKETELIMQETPKLGQNDELEPKTDLDTSHPPELAKDEEKPVAVGADEESEEPDDDDEVDLNNLNF